MSCDKIKNKVKEMTSSETEKAQSEEAAPESKVDQKSLRDRMQKEAEDEVFTEDEKTDAIENFQTTEQIEAALNAPIAGESPNYNAAFFTNVANKGNVASANKYVETASGLKYVIIKEGTGKSPSATDKVTVHYVGTLTDGTQFDSSIDRGNPIDFPLNQVIPGWTEGLQLMKEGGTAVFYIPYQLAYGERGIQDPYTGQYLIPPSSPLIFWVQLIQVN